MAAHDNGGAAFPSANDVRIGDVGTAGHPGMTLRAYIATAALQGILANPYFAQQADEGRSGTPADAAAYHADELLALLAAREQQP